MGRLRWAIAGWVALCAACVTTPAPKLPEVTQVAERQKLAWILQLEDQRILRLELPEPAPPPPPVKGRKPAPVVVPPKPSSSPDLAVLVRDADARIRRRAALAIGRVKSKAGIALLTPVLADSDPDVRATAAFGLGVIGDASAETALTPVLADAMPIVRGRAAEALGLIGAKGAAAAIGQMVAQYAKSPAVAAMQPDADRRTDAPEAEAFALGLFALVRLKAYDPMAAAILTGDQPVTTWWPVAYALQRVEDPRAAPALLQLLGTQGKVTRAFAARGLGTLKHTSAVKPLMALLEPGAKSGLEVSVAAVRALAAIGAPEGAMPLIRIAGEGAAHPNLRLEAVGGLGELKAPEGLAPVQDLMTDDWPSMRAAALRAASTIDQESFVAVLAGMSADPHWRVRAALADILGTLPVAIATERLKAMLEDADKRVISSVLSSMARLNVTGASDVFVKSLEDPDYSVRAAAASALGRIKAEGAAPALREAYKRALTDTAYSARTAALDALVTYGAAEATETLRQALQDKDWAVRVHADTLLAKLEPNGAPRTIAPVPSAPIAKYDDAQLIAPTTSPHVFIETAYGTIEFELAVLDAPQTCRNFVELASKGYFNGLEVHRVVANFVVQDGDPRGDGGGGPGYTIRDELSERPYLRGSVGMAREWNDTNGSQFFITHSPAPHLDGLYTAFGHVVNGMDVVDRIKPGDVIQRVRVWDGSGWRGTR
jgi:cyclophilin family peptidyl-prolyl cis-trans isomerase/HEAT repeat protein